MITDYCLVNSNLVNDGLGGVHAVVVSAEEVLVLGLWALLSGRNVVAVPGLPDEAADVAVVVEDGLGDEEGRRSGVGEGEGQGEEKGEDEC